MVDGEEEKGMKLSGNRFIESVVGIKAKNMISSIEGEIPFVPFQKPVQESKFALITTAGVHLKTDEIFDVDAGDSSVRLIPSESEENELMISHTHYDREDADKDINCVLPITRLREMAEKGEIGGIAETYYGLMGYIPETTNLREETIPFMIKRLKEEKVDAVILSPG